MPRYRDEDDARDDHFRCPICETPTRGGRFCGDCAYEIGITIPRKQED